MNQIRLILNRDAQFAFFFYINTGSVFYPATAFNDADFTYKTFRIITQKTYLGKS